MGLLPIPQEVVEKEVRATKKRVISQIRGKLMNQENSKETTILRKTCIKMSEYLMSGGEFGSNEIDSLVSNMHRSILCLQKRKISLQNKRSKKRRR